MPTSRSSAEATSPKHPVQGRELAPKTMPQKGLEKLGLLRPIDLALHLPLRYEDETQVQRLSDVQGDASAQIEGTVTECEVQYRGRRQLLVTVDDGEDTCRLRFFSFYPSHLKSLGVGQRVRVRGEVKRGLLGYEMLHPAFRSASAELPATLTPIYPTVAGLPQVYLRKAVLGGLARCVREGGLADTLAPLAALSTASWNPPVPHTVAQALQTLPTLADSLNFLHQPPPDVLLGQLNDRSHPAWLRLKAEELLAQQLSQLQAQRERSLLRALPLPAFKAKPDADASLFQQLLKVLPFALTKAQQRVCAEISADLAQAQPMYRLLQGDVGSGKTVVAALAAARAVDAGHQCALMAPTELLAEQHFGKLRGLLDPLLGSRGLCVAWLTGSQKTAARRLALAQIASGQAALVIGTHAVIQAQVQFKSLALAIIDEQHRFGVAQRLALREKMAHTDIEPHLLMMSATPIPRTLAMSVYAALAVSTLDELPPGRTPVLTKLVADTRRDELMARIRSQIESGRQVYWVCPLIEESEAIDLVNATHTHEVLSAALPDYSVALLHSRMKPADKQAVMAAFAAGQTAVLVATTVIEVGVDVPNASLMVIEHAERFGLSQLHQLRGRVGRGAAASACVLLYSLGESGRLGVAAKERLRAMVDTADGFVIAERDLHIRGPGEFLGARQSGAALLRFADLTQDLDWIVWARTAAQYLQDHHPDLAQAHVQRWLGAKSDYLKA
jgi:ATP-dependent DNA helicase RecG